MLRSIATPLLFTLTLIFAGLVSNEWATTAQAQTVSLQQGVSIERTLARGQSHSFNVSLEEDQYLELVVDQKGIDVVVRVFSPAGKMLGEFDSPNGTDGPENVSLISASSGAYRIHVSPLGEGEEVVPGRFEIRIVELRAATSQELQAGQNQEALKAKGLLLLAEVVDNLEQIRVSQTRVRTQLQAAQLLWTSDEKLAGKLVARAIEGVKEYLAQLGSDDEDYYQGYEQAMQLRQEVLQVLGPHDPEMALGFLRSTSALTLAAPDTGQRMNQRNVELQLELSLADQITAKDPKRALQIAEDALKKGYSFGLNQTINNLRRVEPELASKLAKEIATKLQGEKLLRNQEATYIALNLLMTARPPGRKTSTPPLKSELALLSDQEYRDLFEKTLAEALSFTPLANSGHSMERDLVQNILNSLKSMPADIPGSSVASIAAMEKKIVELTPAQEQQRVRWDKYNQTINNSSTDAALEAVGQAPPEMRDQLYQNLAQKAATTGDLERARQLLKDRIANPSMRQQALFNLDQQAIQIEASKGRIVEALRIVSSLRTAKERATALAQMVNLIGPGQKTGTSLSLLEQARNMILPSPRVDSQEQMNALLEIGRAFSRFDSKRAFEVVEPLLDQFNEMSAAAMILNGFGQQYYQEGELIMQNGNSLANTATQLVTAIGTLGVANFDRAKAAADRIERPEVRIAAYLSIAQQAISPTERRVPSRW
jgi:hypothetical protein